MVNINVEIPDELHLGVKVFCAKNRVTLKDFVVSALEKKLE